MEFLHRTFFLLQETISGYKVCFRFSILTSTS